MEKLVPYRRMEDNALHIMSNFLKGPAQEIFRNEIRNFKRDGKSRRYSDDLKVLCIALKFQSPRAYRFLCKIFKLPSISTLLRITRAFQVGPGNFKTILETLAKKTPTMASNDKLCCLTLDEMSLREYLNFRRENHEIEGFVNFGPGLRKAEYANQGLAFMVRGIEGTWKQALGYVLSNGAAPAEQMFELVKSILSDLFKIGLDVRIIISDQGTNNQSMVKNFMKVSKDRPSFHFEDREIFVMFDTPHLIKSVRNMLQKHDFIRRGRRISWNTVKTLFEEEMRNPAEMRLAPKLSHNHVLTPPLKHMKVKYATQIFSNTVSSAVMTSIACNDSALVAEDSAFATFAKDMDSLFDIFNSSRPLESKPFKAAIRDNGPQWARLEQAEEMFQDLQMYDGSAKLPRPPCFDGWLLNIRVLPMIWSMLRDKGLDCLKTRHIQQDCLENLFAVIRQRCGSNHYPNASEFREALSNVMLSAVLDLAHPEGANCERDTVKHLLAMAGNSSKKKHVIDDVIPPEPTPESVQQENLNTILVFDADTHDSEDEIGLSDSQKCILFYVTGHVLRKYLQKHKCLECNELSSREQECTENHELFTYLKAYNTNPEKPGEFGSLTVPEYEFFRYMIHVNKRVEDNFADFAHLENPCSIVIRIILREVGHCSSVPVECRDSFLTQYLETFVRTRLYFVLKTVNQKMSEVKKSNENRKLRVLRHC